MYEMNPAESVETEQPAEEVIDEAVEDSAPAGDSVLDGFEKDLEDVGLALDALDANDLDAAEALTSGLGESDSAGEDSAPTED